MTKVRVGIVGLGKAAQLIHLPALRKVAEVEIVGGFDSAPPPGGLGIKQYTSFDDLLLDGRPDILVVATPPSSHAELASRGLKAGCHIFCEKPLTNDLSEADALIQLSAQVGRHVVVNSEFPFMSIHSAAKNAIDGGRYGALQFMQARQTFVVTGQTEDGWRGEDQQRTFKEFGTHVLDLAKYFFGENPRSIRARMPRPGRLGGADYLNIVELEFTGDRMAHIILDRLARGRHRYLDITLECEKATIETSIGGRFEASAGLRAGSKRPFVEIDVALGGRARLYEGDRFRTLARAPIDLFADGTAALFRSFLAALASGRPPPNNLKDARQTLAMLYACYECAADGSTRAIA